MLTKTILLLVPENTQSLVQDAIIDTLFKTQILIYKRVESKLISSDAFDIAKDEEYTVSDIIKHVGLSGFKCHADVPQSDKKSISEGVLIEMQKLLTMRKEIEDMNQMERMEDLISRNVYTLFNLELEKELNNIL
jgi:hypothetical protein